VKVAYNHILPFHITYFCNSFGYTIYSFLHGLHLLFCSKLTCFCAFRRKPLSRRNGALPGFYNWSMVRWANRLSSSIQIIKWAQTRNNRGGNNTLGLGVLILLKSSHKKKKKKKNCFGCWDLNLFLMGQKVKKCCLSWALHLKNVVCGSI
jgi:hypothetical protein